MRKLILGFALAAFLFFLATVPFHPWLALGVLFLSHLLVLFPTLVANCQWWGPVVTHFETTRREVWLTIDDGPDPLHTPRMIEVLGRFDAKATFFSIGRLASEFPAEIERIRDARCEIGNHTFSHPGGSFWAFPPSLIAVAIDRHPIRSKYFRAPAGLKNFFVQAALVRREMRLVGWTVRGLDTKSNNPSAVVARIRRGLKPGAIVLLHEGHRVATDPDFHPRCLELTLTMLVEEGYHCVLPNPEQLRPRGGEK